MKTPLLCIGCLLLLSSVNSGNVIPLEKQSLTVEGYKVELLVPKGMRIEYIAPLEAPRFITKGPENELIIGSRKEVLYRFKFPYKVVETFSGPNGYLHSAVYHEEKLYVAETAAIWAAPYAGAMTNLELNDFTQVVKLPSAAGGHASRTIISGPDNRLYIGLGISGNCSNEYLHSSYPFESRRGGVYSLDGAYNLLPYSSGLRNPIGLAFHPETNELYATNAGSDNMGYERPPEILAALHENSFHGMPWFQYYDGGFKSGECATSPPPRPASDAKIPVAFFPARSTPEGITFLSESTLGSKHNGNAVVAIHGSWATEPGKGSESRRPPQLSMVIFKQNKAHKVANLVMGFQRPDGTRFARPCGVIIGGDGHLYFTSDAGEVTGLFRLVPVE